MMTIFQIFLLGILLAQAQSGATFPNPERSIDDSDFSKTANYIMKTAMKLPPHILPTLEELDTKDRKRVIQNQVRLIWMFYFGGLLHSGGLLWPVLKKFYDRNLRS
jgi:hypothetical protein